MTQTTLDVINSTGYSLLYGYVFRTNETASNYDTLLIDDNNVQFRYRCFDDTNFVFKAYLYFGIWNVRCKQYLNNTMIDRWAIAGPTIDIVRLLFGCTGKFDITSRLLLKRPNEYNLQIRIPVRDLDDVAVVSVTDSDSIEQSHITVQSIIDHSFGTDDFVYIDNKLSTSCFERFDRWLKDRAVESDYYINNRDRIDFTCQYVNVVC